MSKIARKKLFVDESRIWNLEEPAAGVTSDINAKIRSLYVVGNTRWSYIKGNWEFKKFKFRKFDRKKYPSRDEA